MFYGVKRQLASYVLRVFLQRDVVNAAFVIRMSVAGLCF